MFVPIWQRVPILDATADALAQRAPYARVIGDESGHLTNQFLTAVPKWLNSDTATRLGALVHHGYDYPNSSTLQKAAAIAAKYKMSLWMSEVCCYDGRGFGPRYDPTMRSGMWLAQTIYQDLTYAKDAAFTWWTALSPEIGCDPRKGGCATSPNSSGWDDGLLYYDRSFRSSGNYGIYATKRFWVLGNFSRYVRPGAVFHAVTGLPWWLRAMAFQNADGGWSVIVINSGDPGSRSSTQRFELPGGSTSSLDSVRAYETSGGRSLQEVAPPAVDRPQDAITATTPPQSVTTITLDSTSGSSGP
jgi:O-glycosyl hydrolase